MRNIKKSHLDELKALNNPPAAVKLTLECVVDLIGDKLASGRGQPLGGGGEYAWRDIRKAVVHRDFITSVVAFKSESITDEIRRRVEKRLAGAKIKLDYHKARSRQNTFIAETLVSDECRCMSQLTHEEY